MPIITVVSKGPIRTTHRREIPCKIEGDSTSHKFTAIVTERDGEISVSLEDVRDRNFMPRQTELNLSEYLFWKQIFEVVVD